MQAMSVFRLLPLAAASVAAVWRRSWNRGVLTPTLVIAGSHTRLRNVLLRSGPPSAAGNTSRSEPGSP